MLVIGRCILPFNILCFGCKIHYIFISKIYSAVMPNKSFKPRNCEYCRVMGKRAFNTHNIEDCLHIRREREIQTSQARVVDCSQDYDSDTLAEQYEEYSETTPDQATQAISKVTEHIINRVSVDASPVLKLQHREKSYKVVLDTGATCNLMNSEIADLMNCNIRPTDQTARMAEESPEEEEEEAVDIK